MEAAAAEVSGLSCEGFIVEVALQRLPLTLKGPDLEFVKLTDEVQGRHHLGFSKSKGC